MKTRDSQNKLYIAATPIGNLKEVSKRFLELINEMDILLCEDTRVIKKLLMLLNINKHFQYYKFDMFSELNQTQKMIDLITNGNKVMLLSDAGYPTISDPGYKLVNACIKSDIAIEVINGPCSLIHALVGSGFSSQEFLYLGFLGKTSIERTKKLHKYVDINTTWIILESVHRLKECLKDLFKILGAQNICIAHELTKLHEEFIYVNLSNIDNIELDYKGEFVIVIDKKPLEYKVNEFEINEKIVSLLRQGMKTKDISLILFNEYNLDSKLWYKKIIELKNKIDK